MESKKIINALNEVDDKYIEEAVFYQNAGKRALRIWRTVAIAACVCLAGSLVFTAASINYNSPSQLSRAKSAAVYEEMAEVEDAEMELYGAAPAMAKESVLYSAQDAAYDTDSVKEGGVWNNGSSSHAEQDAASGQNNTKIIYNVWMDMQTREFDEAAKGIEAVTGKFGGYFSNQYVSNTTSGYRTASYTIRVPAENLDALLEQVGDICTVTYISKNAEDVSEHYFDTQSRLTTAKTKLERLQQLLSEAENMEDIISIEKAISDTELEIDNYSGSLRYWDSQVAYSTVNVNLYEVYEIVKEEAPMTFSEKIAQSFEQGIKGFGQAMQDFLVWLANSWIAVILAAAAVVVIILVVRAIVRKRR